MAKCGCPRGRNGCIGRIPKSVNISSKPLAETMNPFPSERGEPIQLELAEFEALRLVELEKMSYCEAGCTMGISRNTIWRLVERGKEKIITAILESRKIELVNTTPKS